MPTFDLACVDAFRARSEISSAAHFYDWLLRPPFIITISGASDSGKTRFACGLMLYAIGLRWNQPPDPYRFYYASAPSAFDEMTRTKYKEDAIIDAVFRHTGMLIVDNLDLLDERFRTMFASIMVERSDRGKITILITRSFAELVRVHETIANRMNQGRKVYL